jgi:hypothetical protein
MAKKTSGEVSNKPAKKVPSKHQMSLKEAFVIVRKCDEEIKAIYSTRTENEVNIKDSLQKSAFKFHMAIWATSISGAAGLALSTGIVPLILTSIFPVLLSLWTADNEKVNTKIQPIKSRKIRAEYNIYEQLIEFHEETMAEQAATVLKKAKKALKVINASLSEYGQELYYNNTRGEEGFAFKEPETVDQFELAFLRASKSKVQSELDSFKAELNAIESKRAA